jgi:hypothetical protein
MWKAKTMNEAAVAEAQSRLACVNDSDLAIGFDDFTHWCW